MKMQKINLQLGSSPSPSFSLPFPLPLVSLLLPLPPRSSRHRSLLLRLPKLQLQTSRSCLQADNTPPPTAAAAAVFDYSSMKSSVFPAEACETIGGEACDAAGIFPEVKLNSDDDDLESNSSSATSEAIDREYLDYNSTKTVFPGEACDDLGGEFCEPEYQSGVH